MHRIRSRLTYANVMATLAVFIALGGTAAAAAIITSNSQVARDTISGHNPPSGDHPNIIAGSVNGSDLATGAVTTGNVAKGAVTTGKLATGAVTSAKVSDNSLTGADVDTSTLNGGGDVSGPLSNLQLGPGTVGRSELASGGPLGVISFFEFSVPANACQAKVFADENADLGEILIAVPESADLGDGVYMRPTVVAHPGQGVLEICNSTGSPVTIPFGTFFDLRLVA